MIHDSNPALQIDLCLNSQPVSANCESEGDAWDILSLVEQAAALQIDSQLLTVHDCQPKECSVCIDNTRSI